MKQADTLFFNAHILTMDEHLTQHINGALAVKGDSILAVGPEDEIKKEYTAKETIDCKGKVLMPGLVKLMASSGDDVDRTYTRSHDAFARHRR